MSQVWINRFAGLAITVSAVFSGGMLLAAAPRIEDNAGFFSPDTLEEANNLISRIYEKHTPPVDVAVVTKKTLPPRTQVDAAAEAIFRDRRVSGVLIFMTKSPHKIAVTVGRHTSKFFTKSDELRTAMISKFKTGNYNEGLLEGVKFLDRELVAGKTHQRTEQLRNVSTGKQTKVEENPGTRGSLASTEVQNESSGFPWWLKLLFFAGIVWIIFRVIGMLLRPKTPAMLPNQGMNPGINPGGFGGLSGGGWGSSIFGGLFGAVAGNYIYDKFFGSNHSTAYAGHNEQMAERDLGSQQDSGDVGSTSSESWGDSSSSDWGGGDSSDFSGGGDFGGGDW